MRQLAGTMRIAGAAERTSHGLWKEPSTSREGQSSLLTLERYYTVFPKQLRPLVIPYLKFEDSCRQAPDGLSQVSQRRFTTGHPGVNEVVLRVPGRVVACGSARRLLQELKYLQFHKQC